MGHPSQNGPRNSHSSRASSLSRMKQPLRVPTSTSVLDIDSPPVAMADAVIAVQTARRRETHRYDERRGVRSTAASADDVDELAGRLVLQDQLRAAVGHLLLLDHR